MSRIPTEDPYKKRAESVPERPDGLFICYHCRAGRHKSCVGVPCRCGCELRPPVSDRGLAAEQAGEPGQALKELAEVLAKEFYGPYFMTLDAEMRGRAIAPIEGALSYHMGPLLDKTRAVVIEADRQTFNFASLKAELTRWESKS